MPVFASGAEVRASFGGGEACRELRKAGLEGEPGIGESGQVDFKETAFFHGRGGFSN